MCQELFSACSYGTSINPHLTSRGQYIISFPFCNEEIEAPRG